VKDFGVVKIFLAI